MLQAIQRIYLTLQDAFQSKWFFLPPNTTALIQPMDQGFLSNFKTYYLRRTFRQMFEKKDGEEKQSIREFWKNYNNMNAVENINHSWNEVTEKCFKGVWKNI